MRDRRIDRGTKALLAAVLLITGATLTGEASAQTPAPSPTETAAPKVGLLESGNLPYVIGLTGLIIAAPFIVIYAASKGFRSE